MNNFKLRPVHPGETLKAELAARNVTAHQLALKIQVAPNRISGILSHIRNISPETALRLGRFFGTGAHFWINLQSQYDLAKAEEKYGSIIEREVIQV